MRIFPAHCPETHGAFITNLSLPFCLRPHTFAIEAAKVAFAITHLSVYAQMLGTEEWQRQRPVCSSFGAVAEELCEVFG